jgi:hypothetical protein
MYTVDGVEASACTRPVALFVFPFTQPDTGNCQEGTGEAEIAPAVDAADEAGGARATTNTAATAPWTTRPFSSEVLLAEDMVL